MKKVSIPELKHPRPSCQTKKKRSKLRYDSSWFLTYFSEYQTPRFVDTAASVSKKAPKILED